LLNEHLLPDAEMTLPAGVLLYLEMDMGSEPLSTIRLKQTRYAAVCNPKKGPFVLYVTLGERRLRNLMTAAGTSATFTYFATLSTVLEHKTKSAFTRSDGQRFFFFPKDR